MYDFLSATAVIVRARSPSANHVSRHRAIMVVLCRAVDVNDGIATIMMGDGQEVRAGRRDRGTQ